MRDREASFFLPESRTRWRQRSPTRSPNPSPSSRTRSRVAKIARDRVPDEFDRARSRPNSH
ncbi:hypothetical protein [Baaleninema sp.]|uniref:hypothetical protein n=1 Tax=Baaleninema sp. TaxID=3101197 RepID=UPI003CFF91E7